MRRRSLTMGEISQYMAQEYGTANFARKPRRGRKRRGSLTSNAVVGRTLGGRLARGAALAGAVGLGATSKGRGLVSTGVRKGYGAVTQVGGAGRRAKRAKGNPDLYGPAY
jgi:hypothetical protein